MICKGSWTESKCLFDPIQGTLYDLRENSDAQSKFGIDFCGKGEYATIFTSLYLRVVCVLKFYKKFQNCSFKLKVVRFGIRISSHFSSFIFGDRQKVEITCFFPTRVTR